MTNASGNAGRRRSWLALSVTVAAAVLSTLASACSDQTAASACTETTEALDPRSTLQLLPTAPEPSYTSDPPTSGPHLMGTGTTGVVDEPLARAVQVGILERGDVVIQYPADDLEAREALVELAGPTVVVAPNPTVTQVVATAWTRRATCTEADPDALWPFIEAHAGAGPQMSSS